MNELKEKIARAINTANGLDTGLSHEEMRDLEHDYGASWPDWLPEAEAALRAIEEAGYVVAPRKPTIEIWGGICGVMLVGVFAVLARCLEWALS